MIEIENLVIQVPSCRIHLKSLILSNQDWLVITGPSGSGKTIFLETIAGFYRPLSGSIRINGTDITDLPPERRQVGIVFQDFSLFPHLSVAGNIGFGLRFHRHEGNEHPDETIRKLASMLSISTLLDRYPADLSGGEKQRVAIARTLAIRPAVLLLDEPASALDQQTRDLLFEDLSQIHRKEGLTTIHVTHNPGEADHLKTRQMTIRNGEFSFP